MQREICERIAQLLASGKITDWQGYEALGRLKLPGPDYLDELKALHEALLPQLYVEIWVRAGDSMRRASPNTRCIGIDPAFNPLLAHQKNWVLEYTTSDHFFEIRGEKARGFDLAFIDGDHSFEQALRDFNNLEARAKPSSFIVLHDVIPMDEHTARVEETPFHTGEVWRLMQAIVAERHDLMAFTLPCAPSGLGIIGRFSDAFSLEKAHWPELAPEYAHLVPFPDTWDKQVKALRIVNKADIPALINRRAAA